MEQTDQQVWRRDAQATRSSRGRLRPLGLASCAALLDAGEQIQVLYIAGTSYCGSTLLSFLLDSHPQVVSVGEETGPARVVKDRLTFPCSCGSLLPECRFWNEVSGEMGRLGFTFGPLTWDTDFRFSDRMLVNHVLGRSLRNNALDDARDALVCTVPRYRRRLDERAARNVAMYLAITRLTGKKVFAAAGKDPIRARYLNRIPAIDLRVVHLIRDAPGYVSSAMKNRNASCQGGIRSWLRGAEHAERLRQHLRPEQFMRTRYEDLCRNVEGELGRIFGFINVAPLRGPIRFREGEHHIIGNRMRLQSSSEVVLDEKWKERLGPDQLREVERSTKSHRIRFGYA